jgi:ubiquinone/menaquinone biosynthesis C-methylase UbiE
MFAFYSPICQLELLPDSRYIMTLCVLYDSIFLSQTKHVNLAHRFLCSSKKWKTKVETQVIPWVLDGLEIGSNVLEVGPGPGVTTELLHSRFERLTCVEIDRGFARSLSRRMSSKNVTVVNEDATAMGFAAASFDAALSFTMLHQVPSAALQDRLLTEVARVLRQGGIFAGVDSRNSTRFRWLHIFDAMVLVDPASFPKRLQAAGFVDIQVDVNHYAFRFRARRP